MTNKQLSILQNLTTERAYRWNALAMLSSMFTYDGLPTELADNVEQIEYYLLRFGYVAIAYHDNKYYVGLISGYEFDEYTKPIGKCTFYTRNRLSFEGVINHDIVIGYNNNIRTPDTMIDQSAKILTEIDKSIKLAVQKTRLNPIPVVRDSKIYQAILQALKDIESGFSKVILGNTKLSASDINSDSKQVEMINLTVPQEVEHIHYLSLLHDDILKRGAVLYGHSLAVVNKQAQVNSDEIKGFDTFSKIMPNVMLTARTQFLYKCNRIFGTEWSCNFSDAWAHMRESTNKEVDNATE